ncbi:uncharacterized protein LOC120341005 isoform X1 [Styela clava]
MPWENCSIYGCNTTRHIRGVGIFKLPSDFKKQSSWRKRIIKVLQGREGDAELQEHIQNGTIRICEKHFRTSDVETYTLPEVDPPRRRLVRGSIPCRYLPPKLLSPESLSSLDESSITKHDRSIDMLEMQYPKNKDNYRNKHKLHQFTKTAVIKPKKFRSFGVDTNEQKETRNFCCQIGKSFIKRPSEES